MIVLADFPDAVSAAALALVVGTNGGATVRTTVLMPPKNADKAANKSVAYQPPGA